jgi:hypothetical protein
MMCLLLAIFVPEIVLACAIKQFRQARKLKTSIDRTRESTAPHSIQFSMASAHFAAMGGYVISPSPDRRPGAPLTLTADGFFRLYAERYIKEEDLDPIFVADKSKADGLTKFLTCIQALVRSFVNVKIPTLHS